MGNSIYKCPVCNKPLNIERVSYTCGQKHTFDIAKEGYVNLLTKKSSKEPGDSKTSVQSRKSFLDSGYYDALSNKINELIYKYISKESKAKVNILDIGCGEGFYLSRLKESLMKIDNNLGLNFWGVDISKYAIRLSSKRDPEVNFCVGNSLDLPFLDSSVDIALSVFAPLDANEVNRVLKDDGQLIVVIPGKNHLFGLIKLVYDNSELHSEDKDPIKGNENLKLIDTDVVRNNIKILGQDKIMSLLSMTPYY